MESANGSAPWALEDVKRVVQHYLLLPDGGLVVEILLAAVVANRMDGDPLWLFLVNPPSGVKTELIRSLNGVEDVYPLSNLTPQTFASGFEAKKVEPSLLLRLDRHMSVLEMSSEAKWRETMVSGCKGPSVYGKNPGNMYAVFQWFTTSGGSLWTRSMSR
jgi:hypothetical protein